MILFLILFLGMNPVFAETESPILRIQSVLFNASNNSIGLVAQNDVQFKGDYSKVRLSQPDRVIIDIPNAFLSTPTRTLPIHQNGIDRVELSQTIGTFYQVVRLTIYATSANALNNIQVQPQANTLLVTMASSGEGTLHTAVKKPPLPEAEKHFSFLDNPGEFATGDKVGGKLNVIQSVSYQNGILNLIGTKDSTLVVKNQFTLTSPKRLVVDIANAVLAEKSMAKPIDVNSDTIRTIRLGQFDENTVRIVVDTSQPNGLYLVYPGEDKHHLALSHHLSPSIRTLPAENQNIGFVRDIILSRKDESSVIRINTSSPMVRRIQRRDNQIEIELANIAAKPSFVAYDKQEFSEIQEIRLSPLNANEPNSKVIIKLSDANVDMDSHVSLDGRTMEVMLTPPHVAYNRHNSGRMPQLIFPNGFSNRSPPMTHVPKGAFTVVVDAGHGGKDLGANRTGVYEKELNLAVAFKLKRALEARGVTVHMTRSSDVFLPLPQITAITNRIRPDAFVSVHTNASVNTSARGIETYYYTPQSRDLAYRVHRRAVNMIDSPDRGVRTARFYVIHHTSVPAILFEMGYISHPAERAALQSERRQRATAEAIAEGVVEFLQRRMSAEAPEGEQF